MMRRKLISFDWAIKKILCRKANFAILEGFLSELLHTDISILAVLESESSQEERGYKFNRIDLKVKDADGKLCIIEVHYSSNFAYVQRFLQAGSKEINKRLPKDEDYSAISKVISVNILHFDLGGDDYIYHGSTSFIGLHSHEELYLSAEKKRLHNSQHASGLYPESYLIELPKFNDIVRNTLDEWIYFLKNQEIKANFSAKGLSAAKETLNVLRLSDSEWRAYDYYHIQLHDEASMFESTYVVGKMEGRAQALAEALADSPAEVRVKGYVKGLSEGKRQIVMRAYKCGIAIEVIADVTDLPVAAVQKILREEGVVQGASLSRPACQNE